jgi:hypothetical protein
MIPAYAKALLDARKRGLRPPGILWVTDAWDIAKNAVDGDKGYALVVDLEKTYDMRVVSGLWVCFVVTGDRKKAAPICQAILEADPWRFSVFDWTTGEREQVVWH